MPYKVVPGEFHLFYSIKRHVGSQPDGDSVWFKPDNPKQLKNVDGRDAKLNPAGFAQLRFEAIDSLELHYGPDHHQNLALALDARNFTLHELGFKSVEYSGDRQLSVKSASPHPVPGYILTRSIDPYGRPVSFVFTGSPGATDVELFLDVALLNKSVNAGLARSGNAYPAFYTGLPTDLRRRIIALANSARHRGLWPKDKSARAKVTDLESLEKLAIWPKLFRRLVSYFKDDRHYSDLSKFDAWLREEPKDRDDELWIVSEGELGNLHDVVEVSGERIAMLYVPQDLIVRPG